MELSDLQIPLNREDFALDLIQHLAGTLEKVVGVEDASGFISVVGQQIGEAILRSYSEKLGTTALSPSQIGDLLVDLKRRIRGDFYVIEAREDCVVLGNRRCPFGERALGHPSVCMMTSNVFGLISAETLGYARVELQKAIARGDAECRVCVYLKPTDEEDPSVGREYFRGISFS